jgi:rubredoxin
VRYAYQQFIAIHPTVELASRYPENPPRTRTIPMSDEPYKSWQCQTCGYVYDEEKGDPDEGLAPGTRWADIPDDWVCPDCGTAKSGFDMVEM